MNTENELINFQALNGERIAYIEARNIPPDRPRINTAFIDIAENKIYGSFYETIALNAGISFKWFTDIDAARA
jgi:hypothetical protein